MGGGRAGRAQCALATAGVQSLMLPLSPLTASRPCSTRPPAPPPHECRCTCTRLADSYSNEYDRGVGLIPTTHAKSTYVLGPKALNFQLQG